MINYKIGDKICFKSGKIKDIVRINRIPVARPRITYIDFWFKDKGEYRPVAVDLIRHATKIEEKIGHRIDR